MAYNEFISRTDAAALIPEEAAQEIFSSMPASSSVMTLARRLPDASRGQMRLPVANALASAYWINPTDTGLKQTSEYTWRNVYLNIEELAVIIPVPESVYNDSEYDLGSLIISQLPEAFGRALDLAVFHGIDAPASFPNDIVTAATAAGHVVSLAAFKDGYDAIMGEGGLLSLVEEDGFGVNGHVAALSMKAKLRGLRGADGSPIYVANMREGGKEYLLDGESMLFPRNGGFDSASAMMISGDWSQLVWAVRSDINITKLTEASIFDAQGALVYNLAQQDMIAYRAVMRVGWALPNPTNRINTNIATRYPFAVLTA